MPGDLGFVLHAIPSKYQSSDADQVENNASEVISDVPSNCRRGSAT